MFKSHRKFAFCRIGELRIRYFESKVCAAAAVSEMSGDKSTNQPPPGYPTAGADTKIRKEVDKKLDMAGQNNEEQTDADEESTDRGILAHLTVGFPYPGNRPGGQARYSNGYNPQNYPPQYGCYNRVGPRYRGVPAHSSPYGAVDDEDQLGFTDYDEGFRRQPQAQYNDEVAFTYDDGGYRCPPYKPQGYYRAEHYAVDSYEAPPLPPPPRQGAPFITQQTYRRKERFGY